MTSAPIAPSISSWNTRNKDVLARDLLRDFCVVHSTLMEQAARFSHSGTISYAVLRELLGEATHKGVFWRLKDTAHLLFNKNPAGRCSNDGYNMEGNIFFQQEELPTADALDAMLHWCIGYAFHECVKLKEDAFQRQHYTNRLLQLQQKTSDCADVMAKLMPLTGQTKESIAREMERILGVLEQMRALFLLYFNSHKDNAHVARFVILEEESVQPCFADAWHDFLAIIYTGRPQEMYVLAAKACLDGGHPLQAQTIIEKAHTRGFESDTLQAIQQELATRKTPLRPRPQGALT